MIVSESGNEVSSWYYPGFTYVEGFDQTADGGFIVIGSGPENQGDLNDILVVKVNSDGGEEWRKYYGTTNEDLGRAIHQLQDESYIIAGHVVIDGLSNLQYYLTKIDENGEQIWEYDYGNTHNQKVNDLIVSEEGNFLVIEKYNDRTGTMMVDTDTDHF